MTRLDPSYLPTEESEIVKEWPDDVPIPMQPLPGKARQGCTCNLQVYKGGRVTISEWDGCLVHREAYGSFSPQMKARHGISEPAKEG